MYETYPPTTDSMRYFTEDKPVGVATELKRPLIPHISESLQSIVEDGPDDVYRPYIAGPMRGFKKCNFDAFDRAYQFLVNIGFQPVNPANLDRKSGFDPSKDVMEGDLLKKTIVRDVEHLVHCDSVVLLPGWRDSLGARAEFFMALGLGLPCYEFETFEQVTADDYLPTPDPEPVSGVNPDPRCDEETPQGRLLSLHHQMTEDCRSIMERKNADYSNPEVSGDPYSNFKAAEIFGLHPGLGLLLRVQDKLKRLQSFIERGDLKVTDESFMDACKDVINYVVLLAGMLDEDERNKEIS